jgi:hypothetical protein
MKMQIVYKPGAADEQKWVLDRHNPAWNVSYPVETATGWGWLEFLNRFDQMSPSAWRALLWALRKQDEQRLQLEWVEINDWTEIDFRFQCPLCKEWVRSLDDHGCAGQPDVDEQPAEVDEPKTKKAGDSDPEA